MSIPPVGPLAYEGSIAIPFINRNSVPTTNDHNFPVPTVWNYPNSNRAWILTSKPQNVANWRLLVSSTSNVLSLQGNSGGAITATSAGLINVVGDASTISISGNSGTNTLTASATFAAYSAPNLTLNVPGTVTPFMTVTSGGLVMFPQAEGTTPNNGVIIGSQLTILPENFLKIGDVETGTTAVLDVTTVASASLGLTSTTGDAGINMNASGVRGYQLFARRADALFAIVTSGPGDLLTINASGLVNVPAQIASPLITAGASGAPTITSGTGAPSTSRPKGSLYLRTDGSGVNDRAYIATDAVGTWTAVVTVA